MAIKHQVPHLECSQVLSLKYFQTLAVPPVACLSVVFLKGDVVCEKGANASELYFIDFGKIEIYSKTNVPPSPLLPRRRRRRMLLLLIRALCFRPPQS